MSKRLTIPLSESAPVAIDRDAWPVIARADWYDGKVECQANEEAYLVVRQHGDDGRRLVYGDRDRGPGGMPQGYRGRHAGYLLPALDAAAGTPDDDATIRALRRVAGVLGLDYLADEAIAALPARELV